MLKALFYSHPVITDSRYYGHKTAVLQFPCDGVFVVISFKTMYNTTIIRFSFCDILHNQGLGKCYQPRPSARLITLTSTLIILDITKASSNNCL